MGGGGVAGSLRGVLPAADNSAQYVLKRAASDNLRRTAVPSSPFLQRVVEAPSTLSGETGKIGRHLNPDAESYIRGPTWPIQPPSAAAGTSDPVPAGPACDSQAVFQTPAHPMDGKYQYCYEAQSRTTAHTVHRDHALMSNKNIELPHGVIPGNTIISSRENPPPVWTQQDHPYSWKARLASGDTVVMMTQDAYSLLTALDPIAYSLPYGVCSKFR